MSYIDKKTQDKIKTSVFQKREKKKLITLVSSDTLEYLKQTKEISPVVKSIGQVIDALVIADDKNPNAIPKRVLNNNYDYQYFLFSTRQLYNGMQNIANELFKSKTNLVNYTSAKLQWMQIHKNDTITKRPDNEAEELYLRETNRKIDIALDKLNEIDAKIEKLNKQYSEKLGIKKTKGK